MTGKVRLRYRLPPDGYEIIDRHPYAVPESDFGAPWVVPRGLHGREPRFDNWAKIPWRYETVGLLQHSLFVELANTPPTREGVIKFANKWGVISRVNSFLDRDHPEQPMLVSVQAIEIMNGAMQAGASGGADAVEKFIHSCSIPLFFWDIKISFDNEQIGKRKFAKRTTYFEAQTVLQFCLLEYLQTLAGGIDVRTCKECGKHLPVPKWGGRARNYCDNNNVCAMRALRKRQSKKRREAAKKPRQRSRPGVLRSSY